MNARRISQFRTHQSDSFSRGRRRRLVVGLAAAALSVASWLFIFSWLSYLPALAITSVDVYSSGAGRPAAMQAAAFGAMSGSYLGLFSKSNALIYPKSAIAAAVAAVSPDIGAVNVRRSSLRSLTISVTGKETDAVVCANLPDLSDSGAEAAAGDCYDADAAGFTFRKASGDDLKSYNSYYIPDLEGSDLAGKFAAAAGTFAEIQDFVNALKTAGIHVRSTLIAGNGGYEVYADNPGGQSIVVIHIDETAPLDAQRDNLIAFWRKMTADAAAKGATAEWSEIKLQYPPNVYYTDAKSGSK